MPTINKNLFRDATSYLLHASAVCAVLSCGGGSVNVAPVPESRRPAAIVVNSLEKADAAQRRVIASELWARRGENLRWSEFWELLNQSKSRDQIITDLGDSLLELHAVDCEQSFYRSFAEFVLNNQLSPRFLIGAERQCSTSLGALLAAKIVKRYMADASVVYSENSNPKLSEWFAFIRKEIEISPNIREWQLAFDKQLLALLLPAYESLVESGASIEPYLISESLQRTFGWDPFKPVLSKLLVQDPSKAIRIFDAWGWENSVATIEEMARTFAAKKEDRKLSGLIPLANHLARYCFVQESKDVVAQWNTYRKVKALSLLIVRNEPLGAQLLLLNQLQKSFDIWLHSQSSNSVEWFVENRLDEVSDPSEVLELVWIASRAPAFFKRFRERASSSVQAIASDSLFFGVDNIVRKRIELLLADDKAEVVLRHQQYCTLLSTAGFPPKKVSAKELAYHVGGDGLPPGCFTIQDAQSSFKISSQFIIEASFDSVLELSEKTERVVLSGSSIRLGFVLAPAISSKRHSLTIAGQIWPIYWIGHDETSVVPSTKLEEQFLRGGNI